MNVDRTDEPDVLEINLNGEGTYAVKVFLHAHPTYAQALLKTPDDPLWHAARDNAIVAMLVQQLYVANESVERIEEAIAKDYFNQVKHIISTWPEWKRNYKLTKY